MINDSHPRCVKVKFMIVLVILGQYMKSKVIMVVNNKSTVFWYVTPYSLLDRLDTVCCLQLHGVRLKWLTFCKS